MSAGRTAHFSIGQIVKHRIYPFRGVIFDVDPTLNITLVNSVGRCWSTEFDANTVKRNGGGKFKGKIK